MAKPALLRIVIVAADAPSDEPGALDAAEQLAQAERSRILRIGLLENGYNIVAVLPADIYLPDRLAQIAPDMIIVDAQSEARDSLEHVVLASRDARRPIVLFTDDSDTSRVGDAIAAGVSAYVVAGLAPERVKAVLDVAMARFAHEQTLRRELADARTQLSERKTLDRAKLILMRRDGLDEAAAYARLRKSAMDKGWRVVEVAQRVVDIADLLA